MTVIDQSFGPLEPPEEYGDLALNLQQQFALTTLGHQVDKIGNLPDAKRIAKGFLKAWFVQKAALDFVIRQKAVELKTDVFPNSECQPTTVTDTPAPSATTLPWKAQVQSEPYETFFQPENL